MARLLFVNVTSLDNFTLTTAEVSVTMDVVDTNSENNVSDQNSFSINLKTLGLYDSAVQLNLKVMTAIKDYLYNTYSLQTNSYTVDYLAGGFGLLSLL